MNQPHSSTHDFNSVFQEEQKRIATRRRLAGMGAAAEKKVNSNLVGLSLSGGGIRSATFNLGLLQALQRTGILNYVDYLSTVSGGGYIGSTLTWFMSRLKQPFPFGTSRRDHSGIAGKVLSWLRAHGEYLTPGRGLNAWALTAAVLTGTIVNLLVLVPVFLLGIYLLSAQLPALFNWLPQVLGGILAGPPFNGSAFGLLVVAGVVLLSIFPVLAILFALGTHFSAFRGVSFQNSMWAARGAVLMYGVAVLVVGTLPLAYQIVEINLPDWTEMIMSGVSLTGALSIFGGFHGSSEKSAARGWRSMMLSGGLALASYGLFLWFFYFVHSGLISLPVLLAALVLSAVLALFANINYVSMHRFYRNRLMEAYLPYQVAKAPMRDADRCMLQDIEQTAAPYHIINTNIQTVGSNNSRLRKRGGDSFILSPLFCGADFLSTDDQSAGSEQRGIGYIETAKFAGGNMNLATAFSISGAAVDPNTYATRSRPLTFIMSLLNIRLGYWVANPRYISGITRYVSQPSWYKYLFREMLGRGLNEDDKYVHLSDGGHFENLGLYELLRRRCKYIIVSDAGADPDFSFGDLTKIIEMARVDFGAKIDLDTTPLRPQGEDRLSRQPFVYGSISYSEVGAFEGSPETGHLIYIKTSVIAGLAEDIYGYRRKFPDFPDQSTADQFFDEPQFEAYRELGFQIGSRLTGGKDQNFDGDLDKLFSPSANGSGDPARPAAERHN